MSSALNYRSGQLDSKRSSKLLSKISAFLTLFAISILSTAAHAEITTSSVSGTSMEFEWAILSGSSDVRFRVGTPSGSISDIYDSQDDPSFNDSTRSVLVPGLPANGSNIRVRLDYSLNGDDFRDVETFASGPAGPGDDDDDDDMPGGMELLFQLSDLICLPGETIVRGSRGQLHCSLCPISPEPPSMADLEAGSVALAMGPKDGKIPGGMCNFLFADGNNSSGSANGILPPAIEDLSDEVAHSCAILFGCPIHSLDVR